MAIGLIVGLGNPGASYENNRHNVGFRAIDSLASGRCEFRSMASLAKLGVVNDASAENLILAKPTTFMNMSGQAVQFLAKFYKIVPERLTLSYTKAPAKLICKGDFHLSCSNIKRQILHIFIFHHNLRLCKGKKKITRITLKIKKIHIFRQSLS